LIQEISDRKQRCPWRLQEGSRE